MHYLFYLIYVYFFAQNSKLRLPSIPRAVLTGFEISRNRPFNPKPEALLALCKPRRLGRHKKELKKKPKSQSPKAINSIAEARKLEHHYPHALKVKYRES